MTPVARGPAQVLIVGAGPSGLMMAAQLLRYGLQPVIIDSSQGPTHQSKALAVQARSLEIYRQLGIADAVINGGKPADGLIFNYDGHQQAKLLFDNFGQDITPFPYVHIYQQSKNERALLTYLTQHSCPVYWNTTLISLQQGTGVVNVTLNNQEQEYNLLCNWLVGADGAHSTVRRLLQIPFLGDTYPSQFFLADVVLNESINLMDMHLTSKAFAAFFPMPEKNTCRIVGNLSNRLTSQKDLKFEDVLPSLQEKVRKPLSILQCTWFTTYHLHHRMAEKFSQGRCFLIGDAAHIHSPVGGQGMNTGLQDAYNLAWKLAGVINNRLEPGVLNTYAAERMPVAKDLLKTTDRAFKIIMSRSLSARLIKKWVMPVILKRISKSDKLKLDFFKRISQTGISYQHSTLSLHLSLIKNIKAGDRLPFMKVYDEKRLQETDLHAWCSKPGFTLITMGPLQELYVFSLAKWITQNYNGWLNFFHLPPSVKNQRVFDAFEIKEGQSKAIIVRPDMHIGLINDVVDLEMMRNYLENVTGSIPSNIAT
jgi:2-polyprenyl-6-methoxyphenol hydroxylase-like FAD-dependent oxidoreductase